MDHIVGGGQVQAGAAGFQADQKDIAGAGLESIHPRFAIFGRGGAVQVLIVDALRIQPVTDDAQVVNELAEHQRLVAVLQQFFDYFGEGRQFAAGQPGAGHHQIGVTAKAPQPGDFRQHLQGFVLPLRGVDQRLQGLLAQCLVVVRLFGRQRHLVGNLGARRQLIEHLAFQPAQNKRLDQRLQGFTGRLLAAFDRRAEAFGEALLTAEQTGIDKAKQVPQLAEVILQRRAGGDQFEVRLQAHRRLRAFAVGVLDRLRLVQHHAAPVLGGKSLIVLLQQAVAGHHQIQRAQPFQAAGLLVVMHF